jgi:hypothetical protein
MLFGDLENPGDKNKYIAGLRRPLSRTSAGSGRTFHREMYTELTSKDRIPNGFSVTADAYGTCLIKENPEKLKKQWKACYFDVSDLARGEKLQRPASDAAFPRPVAGDKRSF